MIYALLFTFSIKNICKNASQTFLITFYGRRKENQVFYPKNHKKNRNFVPKYIGIVCKILETLPSLPT